MLGIRNEMRWCSEAINQHEIISWMRMRNTDTARISAKGWACYELVNILIVAEVKLSLMFVKHWNAFILSDFNYLRWLSLLTSDMTGLSTSVACLLTSSAGLASLPAPDMKLMLMLVAGGYLWNSPTSPCHFADILVRWTGNFAGVKEFHRIGFFF